MHRALKSFDIEMRLTVISQRNATYSYVFEEAVKYLCSFKLSIHC
jgi:hypothetical protein